MSVFVLEDKRYLQFAREISARIEYESIFRYALQDFTGATRHQKSDTIFSKVAEKVETLRKANYESVNNRYKDIEEVSEPIKYTNGGMKQWSDIQFYKTLECINYQLEHSTDEQLLAESFTLVSAMAKNLVHNLPEYQKASWS